MGKMHPRWGVWLLLGGGLTAIGCSRQDTDCLARVAHCVGAKVEAATGGAGTRLVLGLQAARADLDELALDTRVSARLRWDKTLEGAQIQVLAEDGVVELKGTVRDLAQRRRAVELAESTAGAEKVTDSLEEAAAEEP